MKHRTRDGLVAAAVFLFLALLLAVIWPFIATMISRPDPRIAKVQTDMKGLMTSLVRYQTTSRLFPTTGQGLRALVERPTLPPVPMQWTQKIERALLDPWGRSYRYRFPGVANPDGYDLWSARPDGKDFTKDDITNFP